MQIAAKRSLFVSRATWPWRMATNLFVLPFAFDYKGSVGGSASQFAMAAVSTFAFVILAVQYRGRLPRRGVLAYVVWGWMAFLFIGSLGARLSGVSGAHYLRVVYPYALFLEGMLVAWWVINFSGGGVFLLRRMVLVATISMIFTPVWGSYFTGDSIGALHFYLLSPLMPFLLTAAAYDFLFAKYQRFVSFILLLASVTVVAISAVRGMLLASGVVFGALMAAWLWEILGGHRALPKPFVRCILWGSCIGIVALIVAAGLGVDLTSHWLGRLSGDARDVNFWTRVAAVVGEWRLVTAHWWSWCFGVGFGHDYTRATEFALLTSPEFPLSQYTRVLWYPGEFMWVTLWFYSGFIVGSVALSALGLGLVAALKYTAELLNRRLWLVTSTRPRALGALGFLAFLGISITTSPFMARNAAVFMGLCLGMLFLKPPCR